MSVSTPKTTAAPLSARRSNRRSIGGISCLPIGHASAILSGVSRRLLPALLVVASLPACQPEADRRGATVLFASGADLQSINPLLTAAPARPAGAAVRAAHHPRAVRQRARPRAIPRPRMALEQGSPHPHLRAPRRRPLARRRADHGARRGLDARRRARSGDRLSPAHRPRAGRGGPGAERLDRGAALRFAATPLPGRAHRPRHPAGAPARYRAAGPAAAGGVEHAAGRQRPLPVRGARAEPPLGLRRRQRLSGRAGRASAARATHHRGGGRADDQARGAHLGRARLRRHPARARLLRAARSRARGAHLSAAADLWHRAQHPARRRSTSSRCAAR